MLGRKLYSTSIWHVLSIKWNGIYNQFGKFSGVKILYFKTLLVPVGKKPALVLAAGSGSRDRTDLVPHFATWGTKAFLKSLAINSAQITTVIFIPISEYLFVRYSISLAICYSRSGVWKNRFWPKRMHLLVFLKNRKVK